MALDTYSDLASEVADWLEDASLAAKVPTFIRMFEARANRTIRHPDMEAFANLSVTAGQADAPGDFLSVKLLWNGSQAPLTGTSLADLKQSFGALAGTAQAYAYAGGKLYFGPASDETLSLVYYQAIPPLTAENPTNWLLESHPDLYLYGCLVMAEARGWNDERLPMLKAATDEAIAELNRDGARKRHGGPIAARTGLMTCRG